MRRPALAVLLIVVVLGGALAAALVWKRDPMIALGAKIPPFSLEPVEGIDGSGFDQDSLAGRPRIINAFASWCVPCREEHPVLMELADAGEVSVLGMNVQDLPEQAAEFLAELGNPYARIGADPRKDVANRFGFVGLPHTLVLDPDGTLLLSHPGPITQAFAQDVLPAALAEAGVQLEEKP